MWRTSSYSGANENCVEVSLAHWRKSSYSGVNGGCVEAAVLPQATAVRDSKHPEAAVLSFPAAEWSAFLRSALAGRL
jgi:hypothetical protein